MKKLFILLLFFPLISFGQKIKGEKIFSIKAAVGEWQSSVGEYLNLKTIYDFQVNFYILQTQHILLL